GVGCCQLRLGARDGRAVRSRIDREQYGAGFHERAVVEVDLVDRAGDLRPDRNVVDGFEPPGIFALVGDGWWLNLDHVDHGGGRGGGGKVCFGLCRTPVNGRRDGDGQGDRQSGDSVSV